MGLKGDRQLKYLIYTTGDRTQQEFTDIFEGRVDVVSCKFEECHLSRAEIFLICAQLSRLREEKAFDWIDLGLQF